MWPHLLIKYKISSNAKNRADLNVPRDWRSQSKSSMFRVAHESPINTRARGGNRALVGPWLAVTFVTFAPGLMWFLVGANAAGIRSPNNNGPARARALSVITSESVVPINSARSTSHSPAFSSLKRTRAPGRHPQRSLDGFWDRGHAVANIHSSER